MRVRVRGGSVASVRATVTTRSKGSRGEGGVGSMESGGACAKRRVDGTAAAGWSLLPVRKWVSPPLSFVVNDASSSATIHRRGKTGCGVLGSLAPMAAGRSPTRHSTLDVSSPRAAVGRPIADGRPASHRLASASCDGTTSTLPGRGAHPPANTAAAGSQLDDAQSLRIVWPPTCSVFVGEFGLARAIIIIMQSPSLLTVFRCMRNIARHDHSSVQVSPTTILYHAGRT